MKTKRNIEWSPETFEHLDSKGRSKYTLKVISKQTDGSFVHNHIDLARKKPCRPKFYQPNIK